MAGSDNNRHLPSRQSVTMNTLEQVARIPQDFWAYVQQLPVDRREAGTVRYEPKRVMQRQRWYASLPEDA